MLNQFFKKTTIAVSCSSLLFLTACHSATTPSSHQYYVSEKPYILNQTDAVASITTMTYSMENVQGKKADATALVVFPKTAQPKDGWRVVVWEHGTVGSGDNCAPSKNQLGGSYESLAISLLAAGYVIVAPDYEGLGTPGLHPYLNLASAAKSAQYAMKAAQEKYGDQLNGAWMSVGHSQGGHASLATAEYANADSNYKGAVAVAPASSLGEIITVIAPHELQKMVDAGMQESAIAVYSELLSYAAYTTLGLKAVDPKYDYKSLFEPRSAKIVAYAEAKNGENGACLSSLATRFMNDIAKFLKENPNKNVLDYPALKPGFQNDPVVKKFLLENQPGTQKINSPVMIIQGTLDAAVPYEITNQLYKAMIAQGTEVTFVPVEGASHTGALVEKNEDLVNFIQVKMPAL